MKKKGLAVAVILLFIGMCVVPSTAVQELREKPSPISFDGNTLYVGGSGPNNYTTIQSAIDDALDGDTVFVYDDSSPYYETINIQTDIYLIGEDRSSTIIDGGGAERIIEIYSTLGLLKNFTIRNGTVGVYRSGRFNTIDSCTFNGCMIYSDHGGIISNCEVFNCDTGIYINDSDGSDIISCYIHNNTLGIDIDAFFVIVEDCRIDDNELGLTNSFREVYVDDCVFTSNINGMEHYGALYIDNCYFIDNTGYGLLCSGIFPTFYGNIRDLFFINNTHGIELSPPTIGWSFKRNNFIDNDVTIYVQKKGLRITYNLYASNYYDDWDGDGPYHIYGFFNWDWNPEPHNN